MFGSSICFAPLSVSEAVGNWMLKKLASLLISSPVKVGHFYTAFCKISVMFATTMLFVSLNCRCGNVAAILELDEHLKREFTIFEAAPQVRFLGVSSFYKQFELFNDIIL